MLATSRPGRPKRFPPRWLWPRASTPCSRSTFAVRARRSRSAFALGKTASLGAVVVGVERQGQKKRPAERVRRPVLLLGIGLAHRRSNHTARCRCDLPKRDATASRGGERPKATLVPIACTSNQHLNSFESIYEKRSSGAYPEDFHRGPDRYNAWGRYVVSRPDCSPVPQHLSCPPRMPRHGRAESLSLRGEGHPPNGSYVK